MSKRFLAVLLSVIMVMGLVPTSVFANEAANETFIEEAEVLKTIDLSGVEIAGNFTLENNSVTVQLDQSESKGILFTPDSDGRYVFESKNLYSTDSNAIGIIYNYASGYMLGVYDSGGENNNFRFSMELQAGVTYMLEVRQTGYCSDDFVVTVNESAGSDEVMEVAGEVFIGTQSIPTVADDFVMYSFTAPELDIFRFIANSYGGDTACYLYDKDFNLVAEYNNGNGDDFDFTYTIAAGETVYLAVYNYGDDGVELNVDYHHNVVGVDDPPATCTTDGLCHFTCIYCGYEFDQVIPASHNYENGVCTVCGESNSIPYDAVADLGLNNVTISTTYVDGGYVTYKFIADQAERFAFTGYGDFDTVAHLYNADMESIDRSDDSEDFNLNFNIEADLEKGQVVYLEVSAYDVCSFDFRISKVHNHEWSVTKAPDCYNEGVKTGICVYCGDTRTESVPVQHSYDGGLACTICGAGLGGACGDTATWTIANGVLTISGTGWTFDYDSSDLVPWKDFMGSVTKIVIEDGIETIGDYFFDGFEKVTEVVIPDSVWDIHDYAFRDCSSLTSISVNADIGAHAFWGCTSLAEINFGENVTGISDYAFSLCNSLTRVDFPDTVPSWGVGYGVFRECSSLKEVYFPDSFDIIQPEMFSGCTALEIVQLGTSLYSIQWEAFRNCTSLEYITIPSGASYIDEYSFADSGLKEIMFAGSGTNVYDNAFSGVTATAYYPAENAAGEWTADELVSYGGNITWKPWNYDTIGSGSCGKNVTWRVDDAGRLFIEGTGAMYDYNGENVPWYKHRNRITTVVIREGVTHIGNYAFSCCSYYLRKGEIPSSVKSIGDAAFMGCTNFGVQIPSTVEYMGGMAFYGTVFNEWDPDYAWGYCGADGDNLKWEYKKSDFSLTISGTGDMIAYANDDPVWTFFNFAINSVVVKEGVTSIGSWSFFGMLDNYVITLPYSLKKIDEGAFMWNDGKVTVAFSGPAPEIAEDTFFGTMEVDFVYPNKETGYNKIVGEDFGAYRANWTALQQTAAPVVKSSNVASSGKIKLTWAKVEGAKEYKVYRATSKNGKYSLMKTTTGTSYTNTNGKTGTYYYYYVVAVDDAGVISPRSNVIGRRVDCAQPVITMSNVASSGKVKVSWGKVDGAAKYEVYRSTTKNGTYSRKTTTTALSWTDTNTTTGKTYYYKVKAIHSNTNANSAYSAIKSRMCDLARPATVTLSNVASSGKIKVSWTKVTGAVKYQVYRSTTKNGEYKSVKTTTSLSWTDTNTTAGKTYYYKVRALHSKADAKSALTSYKSRMCDLKRPTVSITTSSGKPKVSWKAVTGATKYQVYRATSKNGTYKLVKTTTAKYWKDTTAKKGKTYYYKVVAVHKNSGANSDYSTVVSKKCTK